MCLCMFCHIKVIVDLLLKFSFEATIHGNTTFSDIEKLNYLMSKLNGEVKTSVSGILLSNKNYAVTVELLKERYGDTQACDFTLC